MKRSRQELSINKIVDISIFQNNHIMPFPCFTFIPKTDMGLPKTRVRFYTVIFLR